MYSTGQGRRRGAVAGRNRARIAWAGWPVCVGLWASTALSGSPDLADLDARIVWQTHLPSSAISSVQSYHLVEGRIYALTTDGVVHAVRADNGELAWTRRYVDEGDTLRPPLAYHSDDLNAVAMTRLHDVIFVEPERGFEVKKLEIRQPSQTQIAVAPGVVYAAHAGSTVTAHREKDGYELWRAGLKAPILAAPAVSPEADTVVAVDRNGMLVGLDPDRFAEVRARFVRQLQDEPVGEMVVAGSTLYLVTRGLLLHVIDLSGRVPGGSGKRGDILWQYRLAKEPAAGPVVTTTTIYQTTIGGGLHRIAREPGESKNWYDPQATQFVAEWPRGVVVLCEGGDLALVADNPAEPVAVASAGAFRQAIANTVNDAVILTSPGGRLMCIRPNQGKPMLTLQDFVPATAPAKGASDGTAEAAGTDQAPTAAGAAAGELPSTEVRDPLRSEKAATR